MDRPDLLIVDEWGSLSFRRAAAELLLQVFAARYERRSLPITSDLPFGEGGPGLPGRADDGPARPPHAQVPHLRVERRQFPVPGVDESQEGQGRQEGKVGPLTPPVFPCRCRSRFPSSCLLPRRGIRIHRRTDPTGLPALRTRFQYGFRSRAVGQFAERIAAGPATLRFPSCRW